MLRRNFVRCASGLLALLCGCWASTRPPGKRNGDFTFDEFTKLKDDIDPVYRRGVGSKEPTLADPVDRIGRRLQVAMSGEGVSFDPITISIVASIIGSVIQYCMAQTATRIQRQVQRRPDGQAAVRLRGKLTAHFSSAGKVVDLDPFDGAKVALFETRVDVKKHVDATMQAFATATSAELEELIADLKTDRPAKNSAFSQFTAEDWSRIE